MQTVEFQLKWEIGSLHSLLDHMIVSLAYICYSVFYEQLTRWFLDFRQVSCADIVEASDFGYFPENCEDFSPTWNWKVNVCCKHIQVSSIR